MLDMFPGMACKMHDIVWDLRFNNRGDRVETALMPSLQFASINGTYTNINCCQHNMIISQNRITFAIGTIKNQDYE